MQKVSVIVPIFNAEMYLKECVCSLTCQTHTNTEIILVNDGSTDSSLAIAQQFAQSDPRITILSQDNKGQSAARNKGMTHATGEYMMFVDADDSIDSNFIERHLLAMENTDYVQSGYRRISPEGTLLEERLPHHRFQFISPCMRLYRTAFLKENALAFPEGMIYEDVVFSLIFWGKKPKGKLIHYIGYNYLKNPISTSSRPHKDAQEILFRTIRTLRTPFWLKAFTILRLKLHFIQEN